MLEEITELGGLRLVEGAVAETLYSPCSPAELEISKPADDRDAGRGRDSWRWWFCVKTSEERLVGEEEEEEDDTVWLLPSDSETLMKPIALSLSALVCRGREMMGFETGVALVLRTTAGTPLGLASISETSCSTPETACCGCCTPTPDLVIT